MRNDYYILVGRESAPATLMAWAMWWAHNQDRRHVGKTTIDGVQISTVFIGLNYNFSQEGPPILFETMIFGDLGDAGYQWRCSTWKEAEEMHERACDFVRVQLAIAKAHTDNLISGSIAQR